MNLLECYVIEKVGEPYFMYDFWWQKVKYECHGSIGESSLFHKDKSHFDTVNVGFMFFA